MKVLINRTSVYSEGPGHKKKKKKKSGFKETNFANRVLALPLKPGDGE